MIDKSGIFSLIDEKKFSCKNYTDGTDFYTYNIEKIFNYENYLFVLFSKLYLNQKGDSVNRNHLYLITIDKAGREISVNSGSSTVERELYEIIDNFDSSTNTAKVLDLYEGVYKNIAFISDEKFNITIKKVTENDSDADIWSRTYRKLRPSNGSNTIDLKKVSTSLSDPDYIMDETLLINTELPQDEYDYSEIDQFITLYCQRKTTSGISDYCGYVYSANLGNLVSKEYSLYGRVGGNSRTFDVKLNDENRMLYNYEYYWDKDKPAENYARDMMYFNKHTFNRDSNDNTNIGGTNSKKLFPFFERSFVGGCKYYDESVRIVDPLENDGWYHFRNRSYITDCVLSESLDDNYKDFVRQYNISDKICLSELELDIVHTTLEKIKNHNTFKKDSYPVTIVEEESVVEEHLTTGHIKSNYSINDIEYSDYPNSTSIQYINIDSALATALNNGLTEKNYLQPFKLHKFFSDNTKTIKPIKYCIAHSTTDAYSDIREINYNMDWILANISNIELDLIEETIKIEYSSLNSNYRLAVFVDDFEELFTKESVIYTKMDITDTDVQDKLDALAADFDAIYYMEEVTINDRKYYPIREYINSSSWSYGSDIVMMFISKDAPCNKIVDSRYESYLSGIGYETLGRMSRYNTSTFIPNIQGNYLYDPDKTGMWTYAQRADGAEYNDFFYEVNPSIIRNNKIYINNTSINNGKIESGSEASKYYSINMSIFNAIEFLNDDNNKYIDENAIDFAQQIPLHTGSQSVEFNVDRSSKYFNSSLPDYVNKTFPTSQLTDGRSLFPQSSYYNNIARHYKMENNSEHSTHYSVYKNVLASLNPLGLTGKKYLYILAKKLTHIKDSQGYHETSDIYDIVNGTTLDDPNTYMILNRFNISNLTTLTDNVEPDYICEYYDRIMNIILYYSSFSHIKVFVTDSILDMDISYMNYLNTYNPDRSILFESINGVFTSDEDLIDDTNFNSHDNIIHDPINTDVFLQNKYISSKYDDSYRNFIKYDIWATDLIISNSAYLQNIPTVLTANTVFSRTFTFPSVTNNVPDLDFTDHKLNGVSNVYTISDASSFFETNGINALINYNDSNEFDFYSTSERVKTLYLGSDPIFMLKSFKIDSSLHVSSSYSERNILLYNFLSYNANDGTYSSNCGLNVIVPAALCQLGLEQGLTKYYIVDNNKELGVYFVEIVNANTCTVKVTYIANSMVRTILSRVGFKGEVNITVSSLTSRTITVENANNTLGLKACKSEVRRASVTNAKFTGYYITGDNFSSYPFDFEYGKIRAVGYVENGMEIPIPAAINNRIDYNVYYYNPSKFVGIVNLREILDIIPSSFSNRTKPKYKVTVDNTTIYVDVVNTSTTSGTLLNAKEFFELNFLNTINYNTYISNDGAKSICKEIDETYCGYNGVFTNAAVKENYIDHFIGSSDPTSIFYIGCKYGKIYNKFKLNEVNGDPNFKSFFRILEYGYIPYSSFYPTKYFLTIDTDDASASENPSNIRIMSVLKNNGIVEVDLKDFVSSLNVDPLEFRFYEDELNPKILSTFEDKFYDVNNHKLTNIDPASTLFNITFDITNKNKVDVFGYMSNLENDDEINYFDYLNLLTNKVPFYKLNYNNGSESNYNYYAYSVNNKIVLVRTAYDTMDITIKNTELIAVLNFANDIVVCGNNEYIVAIKNKMTYFNDDNKFNYRTPYIKLSYEDIMDYFYNTLSDESFEDVYFNILTDVPFTEDFLVLKDELIEDTTIFNENKSENYNLDNQTVITKNLLEINYAKLYNVFESEDEDTYEEDRYRLFVCMNGRILVTNELFSLKHTYDVVSENDVVGIGDEIYQPLEIVDFYTINGRVNEIYIERVDVDNNNLMCVSSDKGDLYIFENLFKANTKYFRNKFITYNSTGITNASLKSLYNFNNSKLNKNIITPDNDDERSEYYKKTLTPTIIHIDGDLKDISICDQYLNTLSKEFIDFKSLDDKINFVNNIKYFKLSESLNLNSSNIAVEGNNVDYNANFNDDGNYMKLEVYTNKDNMIASEVNDKYTMMNFRININSRDISADNRYYNFGYELLSTESYIDIDHSSYMYDDKYCLTKNNVIFEDNNIFKNIYIYLPYKTLNNFLSTFYIKLYDMLKPNNDVYKRDVKYACINYDNILNADYNLSKVDEYVSILQNNSDYIYNIPLKLKYNIEDSNFEEETISYEITNLPKKLSFRDMFAATVDNGTNEINRLYFRWRYVGGKPHNDKAVSGDGYEDGQVNHDEYDYYLFSLTRDYLYSDAITPQNIAKHISITLKEYLRNTFDSSYTNGDFAINKIDFDNEYKWASVNLPVGTNYAFLINIIVAKRKATTFDGLSPTRDQDNWWFDEILFEDNYNYITKINLNTIKKIKLPYETLKITKEDYIQFLEDMETDIDTILMTDDERQTYKYHIEWAYQPGIKNGINTVNLIATDNIIKSEADMDTLMKNVFNKMIFISDHDYNFQDINDVAYDSSLITLLTGSMNFSPDPLKDVNPYYNTHYIQPSTPIFGPILFERSKNIYKDFIKWKYNIDSYEDYEAFLWSLILDEADILNYKLNSKDGSFSMNETNMRDRWWLATNNDTTKKWWEDDSYRNMWITENYMPLKNKLYDDEVKVYTEPTYNSGLNINVNSTSFGLLNLSDNLTDILHYGIEKRLITGIYIDGLKLFTEGYYYKDLLNNVQDIYINPKNLKNYFANTEKFPFYTGLLSSLSTAVQYNTNKISLKDILSKIEVNTNFGLVSEQEKLVATITVINKEGETESNITKTVKALNDKGAYYVNSVNNGSINNDLQIREDEINNVSETTFTDQLVLNFDDAYIYDIVNNADRINVYISYKNNIGGKYARRINPKFVKIQLEEQNVILEIKGFYDYENVSTIYIVSGDINNHNLFFKNIDSEMEYVDLVELGTLGEGRLFQWLSYDNIVKAEDVEINVNGYILYPNIDYTIVTGNNTTTGTNLILFRNTIPANGNVSMEINLRPDSDSKIVYKTNQAFALYKEGESITKQPFSKHITMDNDRYQFLYSLKNGERTNKFDVYINNMKVPNKYINVVNSKTINLMVNNKDYAIDLHKTHIAEYNEDLTENPWRLTTEYDSTRDDYRYFDPRYDNIMIVFQNKYNPYNYEIEIENKYQTANFTSLLKNLFFKFENGEPDGNSCYVPQNSMNVYDNFDWICVSNGGKSLSINDNSKINLLSDTDTIINCNIDDLNYNIALDSEPINSDVLNDNILFDCNPLIGVEKFNIDYVVGSFTINTFEFASDYMITLKNQSKFTLYTMYSHEENHGVKKLVLYKAILPKADPISQAVYTRTTTEFIMPENSNTYTAENEVVVPDLTLDTTVSEYADNDIKIIFKLIAVDRYDMEVTASEPLVYDVEFGEITLTGRFEPGIDTYVYELNQAICNGTVNYTYNSLADKIVLQKGKNFILNPDYYEGSDLPKYIPTEWDDIIECTHIWSSSWLPDTDNTITILPDIFNLTSDDFGVAGIACRYAAFVGNNAEPLAVSEAFYYVPEISMEFILTEKDPNTKTCTLAYYFGRNPIEKIPYRVSDPLDETDTRSYKPIAIEATCFNYQGMDSGLDFGVTVTEIR